MVGTQHALNWELRVDRTVTTRESEEIGAETAETETEYLIILPTCRCEQPRSELGDDANAMACAIAEREKLRIARILYGEIGSSQTVSVQTHNPRYSVASNLRRAEEGHRRLQPSDPLPRAWPLDQ